MPRLRYGLLLLLVPLCDGVTSVAEATVAATAPIKRTPFQIRCEDTISKTVSVLSAQQNGYSINNQLPFRALTIKKGGVTGRSQVLGLTRTESRVSVALGGQILQDPASGYECIAPKIDVKLYYVPVVIYVARELAPGTCGYQQVLTHELRHLKAYMDHLPKTELVVRDALARRFEAKPLYAPSRTALSALSHEINSGWLPFIKAELAKAEIEQAIIDSPAEYARLSKSCNGEIQKILQHRPPR